MPRPLSDASLVDMKKDGKTAFPRLRRKIWISLFALPSALMLLIAAASASVLGVYMDSDYRSSLAESLNLSEADFSTSMGVLDDDLRLLASDKDVIGYAVSGDGLVSASAKITSAANANECILGITLYGSTDALKTASSGVSGYPAKSEILSEEAVSSFVASQAPSLLLVRNKDIAQSFGFQAYDQTYGILSFFVRINDDAGTTQGFLVADLDSQFLYQSYFDFSDYQHFDVANSFIGSGDVYLRSNSNFAYAEYLPFSQNGTLQWVNFDYSYFRLDFGDLYVATVVKNDKIIGEMSILISVALVLASGMILGDYFITRFVEKKILGGLDGMVAKMKTPQI